MSDWFDAESHADRALDMYDRGRWAEAESELRKALSLHPDQAEWHYNLGLTLEASGRDIEALASYERVIELLPDQVEPLVAAGVVCHRLRRYKRALWWLDQALTMSPTNASAYAHKIATLVRLEDHDEAEATFYMAQQALSDPCPHCLAAVAESLIEREQFDRAGWCLREALRIEPSMPRLRARLALVLGASGKPHRALQMYMRDLRDDPGNIDTLLDCGELLIDLGRLAEAAEKFRRVLELEPANVDAHFRLGEVAMTSGRTEQASLEFELVLKLDSQYPAARLSLAEAMLARGRVEPARECLGDELEAWTRSTEGGDEATARRASPEHVRSAGSAAGPSAGSAGSTPGGAAGAIGDLDRFGQLLLEAGMPAEAVAVFERLVSAAAPAGGGPEQVGLLRRLAIARFRSGDTQGGVSASRRVLRFDPACVSSIHNLALAALRAGQLRIAAGWIARGLRVDRHDAELRRLRMQHWLAWIRGCVRLIPRAIRAVRAARPK